MTDLSAKKGLLQYEEREFEAGDSAIIYNDSKAVGERTKRGKINIGTAAGIANGSSTVPALFSESELKAAIDNGALPVGTTSEIKAATETTVKSYSPKTIGDAIDQSVDEYVTAILASDAQVAAGADGFIPDAGQVFDNYSIVKKSIAALQALTGMTAGQTAYLSLGGRSGPFQWDGSDLSTEVAADPLQGVYIAPASDPTGASGGWVRDYYGPVHATWFGVSEANSAADNKSAIYAAAALLGSSGTIIFTGGESTVYDIDPVTFDKKISIDGDFPTIRCTTGTAFYWDVDDSGEGASFITAPYRLDGVKLRGDTDDNQRIAHYPDSHASFADNFHIFADHQWNKGTGVTDGTTGFTNDYVVNSNVLTVQAGVHTRKGRFVVGPRVQIEGFETGVFFEGTSIVSVDRNARIRFCQVGIQTKADRDNSNLKVTMLGTDQAVIEYCFVGAYQNELQDSIYHNTFITRCCIPTVSRNTTNITHKKGYFELTHNMCDLDGLFQKDEVYEDCQFSFVHSSATPGAEFIKYFGSGGAFRNTRLTFIRPDIKMNGSTIFKASFVGARCQVIFDKRYEYLPSSANWLYIASEQNIAWNPDPQFTRGGFGITAGSSVTVTHVNDQYNGNYIEITGNGAGADYNGAIVAIFPIDVIPGTDSVPLRISYEYQYNDGGSGDTIEYPFGVYVTPGHRTPVTNIVATNNPVPAGEWNTVEDSFFINGALSAVAFSGGFTGTLRIRNFYVSYGNGFARNYQPRPNLWVVSSTPTTGNWQRNDEVQFRDPSTATYRGAVCSVTGSPGTWRNYGAYV